MLCYNCMREKGDGNFCPYCGKGTVENTSPHQLPVGSVVGGRYIIGKVLGEGGFGITYIGRDNTLDIIVAVKEYFPYGYSYRSANNTAEVSVTGSNDGAIYHNGKERFLNEAKTIAKFLKDPGIVDVRDFFEENNTAYIVMEYLEGIDLRQYLEHHGIIAPEKAFEWLMPVMQSLEKMHKVGIIHRDISPDNIMVLPDGSLKLMDFGAARDFDEGKRSLSVMLKQGYAPEEQYRRNGEQGPWTDVYGICATAYRCITGKTPDDAIDRLSEDHLKPPSALGVSISPETERVLMYGLAVRKTDRCQSMTELMTLIRHPEKLAGRPEVGSGLADSYGVPDKNITSDYRQPMTQLNDKANRMGGITAAGEMTTQIGGQPVGRQKVTLAASNDIKPPKIKNTRKKKAWKKRLLITAAAVLVAAIVGAAVFLLIVPVTKTQTDDNDYQTTTEYMLFSGERVRIKIVDPDGKTIRKSEYSSDILTEETNYLDEGYQVKCSYDEDGRIILRELYNKSGVLEGARDYDYDAKGNLNIETIYDADHNRESYWISEFDETNSEVKGTKFDADDQKIGYRITESDSQGKPMKQTYYLADGTVSGVITFKYDLLGNLIAFGYTEPDMPTDWRWEAEFDPDDHLMKMVQYDTDETVRRVFYFDSVSDQISYMLYDSDGSLKHIK